MAPERFAELLATGAHTEESLARRNGVDLPTCPPGAVSELELGEGWPRAQRASRAAHAKQADTHLL